VHAREVDGDNEQQAARPRVDGVEGQHLLVADEVADQPDHVEPCSPNGIRLVPREAITALT
jgi:hypothetical protein